MRHLQASAAPTLPLHSVASQCDSLVPHESVYYAVSPFFYKQKVLKATFAAKRSLNTLLYREVNQNISKKETS
jgi:hypothetical protein